jgi:hypothetical protein
MEEEKDINNIKSMNIFEKLLNITNEVERVQKNMTVGEGKNAYKAVGEAMILNAVKDLEYKYRVYSYPVSREVLESCMYTTTNNYGEKNNIFSRIKTVYRFVNIDKPEEYIETITFAEGIDNQDNGSGKAMTYADKYALMKAYKIETGDDPDKNPSEEGYKKKNDNYNKNNKSKPAENKKQEVVKLTKETEQKIVGLIEDYSIMRNGSAEALTQHYLTKYNVKALTELTEEQGKAIVNKLIEQTDRRAA